MIPLDRKFNKKTSSIIFDETKLKVDWNRIVKRGNIVYITCGLQAKSSIDIWTTIGTIPDEFKPTVERIRIRTTSYDNNLVDIELRPNGVIQSTDKKILNNQVFVFSTMYFIN